jgi:hypothetical protein
LRDFDAHGNSLLHVIAMRLYQPWIDWTIWTIKQGSRAKQPAIACLRYSSVREVRKGEIVFDLLE